MLSAYTYPAIKFRHLKMLFGWPDLGFLTYNATLIDRTTWN